MHIRLPVVSVALVDNKCNYAPTCSHHSTKRLKNCCRGHLKGDQFFIEAVSDEDSLLTNKSHEVWTQLLHRRQRSVHLQFAEYGAEISDQASHQPGRSSRAVDSGRQRIYLTPAAEHVPRGVFSLAVVCWTNIPKHVEFLCELKHQSGAGLGAISLDYFFKRGSGE